MKPCLFLLLLTLAPRLTPAQSPRYHIDSLRPELARAKADTTRAQLLARLGSWYYSINADSALMLGRQAVELARKTGDVRLELTCRYYLAVTVGEQNIPESMRMYLVILQEAQQIDYWWINQNCLFNMGVSQLYLENYPQAIPYLKRARQITLDVGHGPGAAFAASELANAFLGLHQPDSARHYLGLAVRDYPAYKQDPTLLIYWGRLETDVNPAKARAYFQQCIRAFNALQNWRSLASATRWYSELLRKQHQPDSSIRVAKEGLRAAQRVGILRAVLNNSRQLAQVYPMLNQTDSAYKYQTIMLAARDSLFGQPKINQIQTTLIEEQQRVLVLQAEKSRFESNIKIYALLGLVLLVVAIAGVLFQNDQQKQRANRQLQTLNHAISKQKEEIEVQRDHLGQTLAELQTTQTQLIQKEKLASLGELTAGIAHEIQNPLNFVNNFAEMSAELVDELKEEARAGHSNDVLVIADNLKANLQKIHHHGGRAAAIVRGMLEHSRSESGEKRPTDLNALASEYLNIAYQGLRAKDKTFDCELVTDLTSNVGRIELVPQEIVRVLLNLYNNAFYAVHQKQKTAPADYQPTVTVSTRLLESDPLNRPERVTSSAQSTGLGTRTGIGSGIGHVEIRVSDNGTGIPDAVKAKIFQPFFTTKPTGEGTGLGLSLSYDIVTKSHGGTLEVVSEEGKGTEFVVTI